MVDRKAAELGSGEMMVLRADHKVMTVRAKQEVEVWEVDRQSSQLISFRHQRRNEE
jgi:hypothetical protein